MTLSAFVGFAGTHQITDITQGNRISSLQPILMNLNCTGLLGLPAAAPSDSNQTQSDQNTTSIASNQTTTASNATTNATVAIPQNISQPVPAKPVTTVPEQVLMPPVTQESSDMVSYSPNAGLAVFLFLLAVVLVIMNIQVFVWWRKAKHTNWVTVLATCNFIVVSFAHPNI